MYIPLNYEQISTLEGLISPSDYNVTNTIAFEFWCRSLYRRVCSRIKFTKIPETWQGAPKGLLYWTLITAGYACISRDEGRGYWFQPCGLYGYNFYYQPIKALIENPLMQAELSIGTECELVRITDDYFGLWDIIGRSAAKLSNLDNAIDMAAENSKLAYIGYGSSAAAIRTLKTIRDRVSRGQSTIFADSVLKQPKTDKDHEPIVFTPVQDVGSNYILDKLLADSATLLREFDSEIGIPGVPYDKKERLTQYEGESRKTDAAAPVLTMEEILQSSLTSVKALYPDIPLDAHIIIPDDPVTQKGGASDGNSQTDIDRA